MIDILFVFFSIFLIFCTYTDFKDNQISLPLCLFFGAGGIACNLIYPQYRIETIVGGVAIGIFMLLLSKITREAIGYGDGVVILVSGIYLGFVQNLTMLLYGLFLSAIISGILLVFRKRKWRDQVPFVPFLLAAYLLMQFVEL